jgi:integrase
VAKALITNAQSVETLRPKAARYVVADATIGGLECRVHPDGTKVWTLRYRNRAGEQRRLKLGEYSPTRMTLSKAREAANRALRKVDDGIDPQGERQAEKRRAERARRDSIDVLTTDYLERHAKPKKRTWAADAHKVKRVILPAWKGRPVTAITRRDCRDLVQSIADRGAPIQANRVAALLSRLFRFAVDEELIPANIAAQLPKPGAEIASRPEAEREVKPYTDDEIAAIWRATATLAPAPRSLYRLGLITGQRPGEIGDMAWSELAGEWWTIPAERAKNNRSHRVFLSPVAVKALADVPRHDALVFAGYRGKRQLAALNTKVFAHVRRREKPRHAMRDTVATRMADAGVPVEDISRVLNHAVGLRVTAGYNAYAYDREKREALELWATTLTGIVNPRKRQAAKVIPMRHA